MTTVREFVRERTAWLAAGLTLISAAVVFAATLELIPRRLLPRAPDVVFTAIPHVNAVLAVAALAAMGLGLRAIHGGSVDRHRRAMLLALLAFAAFLLLYLYNVALTGPASFPGPDAVRLYLYLPLLVVHVGLAVLCLPLLYYVVLLAVSHPVSDIPETNHARVARPALVLWAVSFVLGLVVYGLLYVVY